MTPTYLIHIRRDANTITPVNVPEYEVPILQEMFGTENVHNADGKRVDEAGIGICIAECPLADDEFARLAAKYGASDEGLVVEQVYGKKASKGLEKAIAEARKRLAKA